jgi:hypothetical protein
MKHLQFMLFWLVSLGLLAVQVDAYYDMSRQPLVQMRNLLGFVPEGARVVGYANHSSARGGVTLWNLTVSRQAAAQLRSRCVGDGQIRPLNFTAAEIQPGTKHPPVHPSAQVVPPANPRSQACLIASRKGDQDTYSEATLENDLIQLLVAL